MANGLYRSVLLVAAALLAAHVGADDPFMKPQNYHVISKQFRGLATNYGGPYDGMDPSQPSFGLLNGGCGYGNLNNENQYPWRHAFAFDPSADAIAGLHSFGCGSCWKLTNTANYRAVIAMVTDICPGCNKKFKSKNHMDIHYDTWIHLHGQYAVGGILDVIAERVPCSPNDDLELKIKDFQGTYSWLRLYPWKVAGRGVVKQVQIVCPNSITFMGSKEKDWVDMWDDLKNTYGAVWEIAKIPLYAPGSTCFFHIVSEDGTVYRTAPMRMDQFKGTNLGAGNGLGVGVGGNFGAGRKLLSLPSGQGNGAARRLQGQ